MRSNRRDILGLHLLLFQIMTADHPASLQALLESADYGDRIKGLNQLRDLDRAAAFPLVQPLITDENVRVRYAAVSLMDSLGLENPDVALELLRDRLLNDPEIDVRAAAADALGALKLTAAFEDMQALYRQTSEWLLQFSIIAALGELGDPRGFDLLVEALGSETEVVKTAAVGSLGELGDARAVPLLAPIAGAEDWQLRFRVAQALGRLGGPEAQTTLETLAEDSVEQVAAAARSAMG